MMKQIGDSTKYRWYITHMGVWNDFTRALDDCLVENHRQSVVAGYSDGTYLWLDKDPLIYDAGGKYSMAIRVPGATRGHLILDPETEQIILIELCDSAVLTPLQPIGCYTGVAESVARDWVGKQLPDITELFKMMEGL